MRFLLLAIVCLLAGCSSSTTSGGTTAQEHAVNACVAWDAWQQTPGTDGPTDEQTSTFVRESKAAAASDPKFQPLLDSLLKFANSGSAGPVAGVDAMDQATAKCVQLGHTSTP